MPHRSGALQIGQSIQSQAHELDQSLPGIAPTAVTSGPQRGVEITVLSRRLQPVKQQEISRQRQCKIAAQTAPNSSSLFSAEYRQASNFSLL